MRPIVVLAVFLLGFISYLYSKFNKNETHLITSPPSLTKMKHTSSITFHITLSQAWFTVHSQNDISQITVRIFFLQVTWWCLEGKRGTLLLRLQAWSISMELLGLKVPSRFQDVTMLLSSFLVLQFDHNLTFLSFKLIITYLPCSSIRSKLSFLFLHLDHGLDSLSFNLL